ncbi:MAG: DUF47 family protein [Candidatus Nitrosopolaris sp.]
MKSVTRRKLVITFFTQKRTKGLHKYYVTNIVNIVHIRSGYIQFTIYYPTLSKGFLSWIRSKDKVIINLLEQQAAIVVRATSTLIELATTIATNPDKCRQYQSQIRDFERDGDQLNRKLFTILDETFVTPLDREDLSKVSNYIEKILNHTHKVADRFVLFNIGKPSSDMLELVTLLSDVSQQVSNSISQIRKLKKASIIIEHSNNISRYEARADSIYEKAISALFRANDAIEILRSKEIYDFLQRAINRCVDLSELLEDVALKYA